MTYTPEIQAYFSGDERRQRWLETALADLQAAELHPIDVADHLGWDLAYVAGYVHRAAGMLEPGAEVRSFSFSSILGPCLALALVTVQEGREAVRTFYYSNALTQLMPVHTERGSHDDAS